MTKARAAVRAALEAATEPLPALAVASRLSAVCDQATVYRALHWLEEHGEAESFALYCSEHGTERYYAPRSGSHRHWFHCVSCHRFVDLGACVIGGLVENLARERGLDVMTHTLYLTGLCAECRVEAGPPAR